VALSHDEDEARRERVLRSLGGQVPACFTVTGAWRGESGRLPRALRQARRHVLAAINHGEVRAFELLLASGIDPVGVRDRRGRGLLHMLAQLDRPDLVPRLVAAGVDVNAADAAERSPLLSVLLDGASAAVVRALLDAGADPHATDMFSSTALHLLCTADAATVLPWLLDAGLDI